jgi:hypothetical protein
MLPPALTGPSRACVARLRQYTPDEAGTSIQGRTKALVPPPAASYAWQPTTVESPLANFETGFWLPATDARPFPTQNSSLVRNQ